MSTFLFLGRPNPSEALANVMHDTQWDWSRVAQTRLAFAYVSYAGLLSLLRSEEIGTPFGGRPTRWVIGLHHGITEPLALSTILALPKSRLWLFAPGGRINTSTLLVAPRLHAKIIAADSDSGSTLVSVVAGSANLTSAAVARFATNYEAGIALRQIPAEFDQRRGEFDRWWDDVLANSLQADRRLVGRYANVRSKFLQGMRRPIDLLELDPPDESEIATARFIWIEAGDMSGGNVAEHRYQTEINGNLASFFHVSGKRFRFPLVMPNGEEEEASLTSRAKYHFVHLWRLGLPHPRRFGLVYRGNVLCFERLIDGRFRVAVAEDGSSLARKWANNSHRNGHFDMTGVPGKGHGRAWGYYS